MVHKMKLFQKIFPYWAYKILDLEKRLPDSAKLQDLVGKSLDTISDVAKNIQLYTAGGGKQVTKMSEIWDCYATERRTGFRCAGVGKSVYNFSN